MRAIFCTLLVLLVMVCAFAVPADRIPGLRPAGIQPPPPVILFSKSIPRTGFQTHQGRERRHIIEPEMIAPTYTLPEIFTDLTLNNPDFNIASGSSISSLFITTPYKPSTTGTQFVVHNFVRPDYMGETFQPHFKPLQIPPSYAIGKPYPPAQPALVYGIN